MKRIVFAILLIAAVLCTSLHVFAEFRNETIEDESQNNNNSFQNAFNIYPEVLMQGNFPYGDNLDFYKFSAEDDDIIYVQLSQIHGNCDYDLWLYNSSYNLLKSSRSLFDRGEFIEHTATYTGTYYIKVERYSGPDTTYRYKLYAQTNSQYSSQYCHSFYVEKPRDSNYMYYLGRDHTNNMNKTVILHFGQPDYYNNQHGVWGFDYNFIPYSDSNNYDVIDAVNDFITGYNANPKHTKHINIIVGVSNLKGALPQNTSSWYNNGVALKNCVLSISTSGDVDNVYGGYDAEMGWNEALYTKELARGFNNSGYYRRLYNFGSHNGAHSYDWSGQTDPYWDVPDDRGSGTFRWYASDVHYISYGLGCAYASPQIYNYQSALRWTYQKKWAYAHGKYQKYEGLISTNKWSESSQLLSNYQSYWYFDYYLNSNGVGEDLENPTWMAMPSQDELYY